MRKLYVLAVLVIGAIAAKAATVGVAAASTGCCPLCK